MYRYKVYTYLMLKVFSYPCYLQSISILSMLLAELQSYANTELCSQMYGRIINTVNLPKNHIKYKQHFIARIITAAKFFPQNQILAHKSHSRQETKQEKSLSVDCVPKQCVCYMHSKSGSKRQIVTRSL